MRVVKPSTVLAVGILVGRSLRFSHGFLRLMPGCIGGNYIPRKVTLWHPKSNKIENAIGSGSWLQEWRRVWARLLVAYNAYVIGLM